MRNLVLDRDGTLIRDRGGLVQPAEIELLPGVVDGLRSFAEHGCRLFVITNQAAIGRGVVTRATFAACMSRLEALLAEGQVAIDAYYMCPDADEASPCRKPNTGLWERLRADHPDVCARETLVVGDKDSDITFGRNVGAGTARVRSAVYPANVAADHTIDTLAELAAIVFAP